MKLVEMTKDDLVNFWCMYQSNAEDAFNDEDYEAYIFWMKQLHEVENILG